MKCPYCGTEHSAATCPGCGSPGTPQPQPSPAGTQPGKTAMPRKPKKPLLKRWWFWAFVVIVLIAIIANLGKGNQGGNGAKQTSAFGSQIQSTDAQQTVKATATPAPGKDLSKVEKLHTLKNGHYVAGVDIPAGKCNVTAVEGKGNLNSSNLINGGINEMFGIDTTSDLFTKSFNGLKLPEGTVLNVSGGLTIQLDYTAIDSDYSGRTYDESKAKTLETGNYEAGADFDAGVYKIVAVSGSGNLSSSNLIDGGVNEMFGVDNGSGLFSAEFTNVDLPKGTELSVVGGLTIKLIPATTK